MTGHAFSVPHTHPALPGHFPGRPLVPGVVLLQHLLETLESRLSPAWPLNLRRVRFLAPVRPGETLEVVLDTDGDGRARLTLLRAGQRVLEADVAWHA